MSVQTIPGDAIASPLTTGLGLSGMVFGVPSLPELELHIVALSRYIDSCRSAPAPHSDCPLATSATTPPAECLSECQQALSALLRRGRAIARTGPDFDARQLRLSEETGSPALTWHVASLIEEVVKAARTHPNTRAGTLHLKRWVYGTSALGALGCRGVDPEALLRYGVGNYVKIGISTWLEVASANPELITPETWPHYARWRDIFEPVVNQDQRPGRYLSAAFRGPVQRQLESWLATAPVDNILQWIPPTAGRPDELRPAEEVELWTWVIERFSRTYLDSWSLNSLKREYLHLKGETKLPIPEDVLAERVVQQASLTHQIADMTVRLASEIDPGVLGALTEQAADLLRDGERRAAAALFDGARALHPNDHRVLNNYAFCVLLDNPAEARELFLKVMSEKNSTISVTLCNLALVEHLLGNPIDCLRYCEQVLEQESGLDGSAFLWRKNADDKWAVATTSPRQWVVPFAESIRAGSGRR